MKDAQTSEFYSREAEAYAERSKDSVAEYLPGFMAQLRAGGSVLELGCGAGQDSEVLIAAGFDVTPSDGTPAMAAVAQVRLGRPVKILPFDEISEMARYDGVWAKACLLHAPRTELGAIISRIHRALLPGGVFYASFKAGSLEDRDQAGRYYNRPDSAWLTAVYEPSRWTSLKIAETKGGSHFGEPTEWLHVIAIKP